MIKITVDPILGGRACCAPPPGSATEIVKIEKVVKYELRWTQIMFVKDNTFFLITIACDIRTH